MAHKRYDSIGLVGMDDWEKQEREARVGHEFGEPGREAPAATRTTSCPWSETPQRKPLVPVEDISTPSIKDGVSFRQKL